MLSIGKIVKCSYIFVKLKKNIAFDFNIILKWNNSYLFFNYSIQSFIWLNSDSLYELSRISSVGQDDLLILTR